MNKQMLRKGTMLRNMIVSYSLIVLAAVLVTAIALTFGFQRKQIEHINRHMVSMLEQASHTASLVIEQGNIVGMQANNDWLIVNTMNAQRYDPLTEYVGLLKLREYKNSNILLDHLGIYCWKTDRYICDGMVNTSFVERYRQMLAQDPTARFYVLQEHIEITDAPPRNLITFAYRSRYGTSNMGCVTVSFDHRTLVDLARPDPGSAGDELFIMDESGQIISHPDNTMFMTSLAGEGFAQRILGSQAVSGNFVEDVFGESSIVCYTRDASTDWIFVSTHPYTAFSESTSYMMGVFSIVVLIVSLIAISITLRQSRSLYDPLGSLVEQVGGYEAENGGASDIVYLSQVFDQVMDRTKHLQNTLSTAQDMIGDSLYSLLLGGRADDIPGGAEQMLEELELWKGRYFAVALIQLDMNGLSEKDSRGQWEEFVRQNELALERLQPECTRSKALYMDGYIAALIVQFDGEVPAGRLDELREECCGTLSTGLRMSVGGPVKGMEDLSVSYRQAQIALKYSYQRGTDRLLAYEEIESYLSNTQPFPIELEKEILEVIRQRRTDEVGRAIAGFVEYIRQLPAEYAMQFMDQLRLSVYKAFYEFLPLRAQAALVYTPGSDFRELESEMQELARICELITRSMGEQQLKRSQPVVDDVRRIIETEYADPNLTIDVLGARMGLSANYLSRIYKTITGDSLHSSLTGIRMERAKELLRTTEHSVGRVSEMVGIENSNYFYTLFKRAFGLTPTEYRNGLSGQKESE